MTSSPPPPGTSRAGVPLAELGTPVDPAGLVPGLVSLPEARDDGAIAGEVWWVDRFGNCQLNIDPDELARRRARTRAIGSRCTSAGEIRAARWVHTYADAKPSELVLLVDSYGLLALALDRESAAADARPARRQRRHPRPRRRRPRPHDPERSMRQGTTIAIVILLVLILGAAAAQFVLRLGP